MTHDDLHPDERRLWQTVKSSGPSTEPCLDDLTLAALLDDRLAEPERQRAEAHLASCETCLSHWMEGHQLIHAAPMLAPDSVFRRAQALITTHAHTSAPWSPMIWRSAAAATILLTGTIGYSIGGDTLRDKRFVDQQLAAELSFGSFEFDAASTFVETLQ